MEQSSDKVTGHELAALEAVISSLPEPTLALNAEHVVLAWNQAMERLTGLPASAVVGDDVTACRAALMGADVPLLAEFVGMQQEQMPDELRLVYQSVAVTNEGAITAEACIDCADAAEGRHLLVQAAPLKDGAGRICGSIQTLSDTTDRRLAERMAQHSEREERAFRKRLEELNELNAELAKAHSMSDLHEMAVELGRTRLGFDRLGLWLSTDAPDVFAGTFGTDEAGNTRDETGWTTSTSANDLLKQVSAQRLPVVVAHDRDLLNHKSELVGRGDMAAAQLWDGERIMGFVTADNLLCGKPLTLRDVELLRLYAVNLAHVFTRKAAEEELRSERDFANTLIETAPVIVLVLDQECRILRLNSFAESLLGYSLEEVVGSDWISTFIQPRDRQRIRRVFQGSIDDIATNGSVNPIVTRDGSIRHVEWYDRTIRDKLGNSFAVLCIGLDVSDRVRYEDELRQSQKMEAIGRLAGGIAHDFNNQLTVIKGYSDLILRQLEQDNALREQIQQIKNAAVHAESLTTQLLTFSRKQMLQPQVVNLANILRDMRNSLDTMTGRDMDLKIEAADDLWCAFVDPMHVRQAVMNIVVNAHDAMRSGGRLSIRAKNVALGRSYSRRHKGAKPGPHVAVSFKDTGPGMDEDTLKHALDPFFTTKPLGEGTGLGLSMVYGFVNQSGGHMTLSSRPGAGTTIRFYLPARKGKAKRPKPRQHNRTTTEGN